MNRNILFRPLCFLLFATSLFACSASRPPLEQIHLKGSYKNGKSKVYELSVFRENKSDVTFKIDYFYDGGFGEVYYKGRKQQVAMLGIQPLLQGRKTCGQAKPVVIKQGHRIAYPKLLLDGFAAKGCTSDQLAIFMFTPEKTPITVGLFKYRRDWR